MTQKEELLTRVEIDVAIVGMRRDGIMHAYLKPGTVLDVRLQERLLSIYIELARGEKRGIIYEAGPNFRLTREARENAFRLEDLAPIKASAVLVKNWYQKVVAEFYYKVRRPKGPYTVVWDFDKGIHWLRSYSEKKVEMV